MARILQIALLGHPVLRQVAQPIAHEQFPTIASLVSDLHATMLDGEAVGLAAPQVYESTPIFVMRSRRSARYPNAPEIAPMEVVNPQLLWESEELCEGLEAVPVYPGYKALICRPISIRATWQDLSVQRVGERAVSCPTWLREFFSTNWTT